MAITNLSQYYGSIGKPLPSITERAQLYSGYGLGTGYAGTAQQNSALLSRLTNGTPAIPAPVAAPQVAPEQSGGYGDLMSYANEQAASRKALTDRLNSTLEGSFDKFSKESGAEDLRNIISTYKNQIFNANQQLFDLPQNVTDRVAGSLTTEAQRQRQVAAESQPIQLNIARLGASLQPALEGYTAANEQIARRMDILKEQQSRELSGFDKDAEIRLAALQDKIDRGRQLTDREWQEASDLMKMKKQHEYNMIESKSKESSERANSLDIEGALKKWMELTQKPTTPNYDELWNSYTSPAERPKAMGSSGGGGW